MTLRHQQEGETRWTNHITVAACAATSAPAAALSLDHDPGLTWYRSSDTAERGFCRVCGGNLFWRVLGSDAVSIMAGTLDAPTGLRIAKHIFVADKSDYYSLDDGAPQLQGWH